MEWIQKKKSSPNCEFDSDVIVSIMKRDNRMNKISFRFRKNSVYKIDRKPIAIVFAKEGSRIYFKGCGTDYGFKLVSSSPSSVAFSVNIDRFKDINELLGEYDIEFDSNEGLHFIDLNHKHTKSLDWRFNL